MRIDLVRLIADLAPRPPNSWPLGAVWQTAPTPSALASFKAPEGADWLLFWSVELGEPSPERIAEIAAQAGPQGDQAFHAGLLLGQAERPRLLDFVHPTWMLHHDPPAEIDASSWRLSLRVLLVPAALWRCGACASYYKTLDAAALELGWRWLWQGVLLRHLPGLLPGAPEPTGDFLPLEDELRFLLDCCGKKWAYWATARAFLSGARSFGALRKAWRNLAPGVEDGRARGPAPTKTGRPDADSGEAAKVTVLIPTLDRYPYLEVLLEQLGQQTLPPLEVIVVDQTPAARRHQDLEARFPRLPLRVIVLEEPGQCSSRNAGLLASQGDFVLFLDDDDEVAPDLIARHLASLARSGADVSCGVADEVGAGPLPAGFERRRLSDVFPTNNSLLRRELLERSLLFDLAFEKGARADADLGHRLYLAGALMVLDPEIRVLHHHAPIGGLRKHGARRSTYAASRQNLFTRHLPEPTEIYLALRYFSPRQAREALWLQAAGTFAVRGGRVKKILRAFWALFALPDTLLRLAFRRARANELLAEYPRIPRLLAKGSSPDDDAP